MLERAGVQRFFACGFEEACRVLDKVNGESRGAASNGKLELKFKTIRRADYVSYCIGEIRRLYHARPRTGRPSEVRRGQ